MPEAQLPRVLVAHGQPRVGRLVEKLLGALGFEAVQLAFDTATGLHHIRSDAPDIVIVDANIMPMPLGRFIGMIRCFTGPRSVSLLMTTSLRSEASDAAVAAGIGGVILQPFTAGELKAALVAATRGHRPTAQRLRGDAQAAVPT